jgi:peptidoglycan/xylan/chitin deacetylase (PgdA/CDA1 family)
MNTLRVLAYHRVADFNETARLHPRLISATPAVFARQMDYLARHYHVVSMEEVLEAVQHKRKLSPRALLITFDDAYCDFKYDAWRILKHYRLPVTVFVPTAFPGQPPRCFWWDRLYYSTLFSSQTVLPFSPIGPLRLRPAKIGLESLKRLENFIKTLPHDEAIHAIDEICLKLQVPPSGQRSTMTWDDLRQLSEEGVSLGAHAQTHPILTRLPLDKARDEILGAIADLKREIGHVLPIFCYPNGNTNNQIITLLKEENIMMAFGGKDGHNYLNRSDILRLHRTSITPKTSPFIFRLRLLPLFTYFDKWRHHRKT